MDERDVEPDGGGLRSRKESRAAVDRIVDPIVAVADGVITHVNPAARKELDLPSDATGQPAADVLGAMWDRLETEIAEAAIGTAREVALSGKPFDARVHRSVDGATVTFDREGLSHARDRVLKERAIESAPVGFAISDPDREDNPLIYVNDAYREMTGYAFDEAIGRNCRFLQGPETDPENVTQIREAVAADRPVTVELRNYRKDGTGFWNEVTIAPVRDDDGEVTNYVGFQNDVTARKEAELEAERRRRELDAERAELERVLERVGGLVADVTTAVAGSTCRNDLEEAVAERFAREPACAGVWIGERNPATRSIEPRASAGFGSEELGEAPQGVDDGHPVERALAAGELVVGDVDGTTVAAAPLTYNDVEYGVLALWMAGGHEVNERESVIISALARAIASGINARETSRMLATDAVVAVEVELVDDAVGAVALSDRADCELEYRRSVHRTDEPTASLYTARGATADELAAAAEGLPIEFRTVVDREDEPLIEIGSENNLVGWLSERGAVVREIAAEDGRARLVLELPRSANVRSIVEAIQERHPGTDVISFRQRERDDETRQEFAAHLEEELTERQLAALQRAYLGGYFEWPRPTTGEELAESMDVSRPTFHEHLRSAEGKLCKAFFDG